MVVRALGLPPALGILFEVGTVGDLPDGALLDRFAAGGEGSEAAFRALLERHGAMVLRVCQRMLADPNDAEDAFQATFLVLLRRAGSIRDRDSVAAWLHGVAVRVGSRARVEAARRRRIERQGSAPAIGRNADPDHLDLADLIDGELARLPEKYRRPIVLCYLEGLTHEGAAARLGWPVGTVRGRLARGRDLLRSRLVRRGATVTSALAAVEAITTPARAAVPSLIRESIVRLATGSIVATGQVAAWVAGVSAGMVTRRVIAAVMAVGLFGSGIGLAMRAASPPPQQKPDAAADSREAIRREMLRLKGTWATTETVQETVGGIPQPPRKVKFIWSIDRDTITQSDESGHAGWTFRFTLDPGRAPRFIDLECLNRPGLTLRGIYRLDGDTLTLCESRRQRPGDFEDAPDRIRIVLHREGRTPTRLSPEYTNAEGCYWAVEPRRPFMTSLATGSIHLLMRKDLDGALRIVLASVAKYVNGQPEVEFRPVAFDRDDRRHLLEPHNGGWSSTDARDDVVLAHQEFRLDPVVLPFDRVKAVGIEVVPAAVRRAEAIRASEQAIREAHDAGIEILPRPEVGRPFAFSLTDSKGRVLRSGDLAGKVVLIDCWASWSGPSTLKFPKIKALYERHRGNGFEVIGLNFDKLRGPADNLVRASGLPWPQVFVPVDDRTRRLWKQGPGLPTYPRSFLIDREGILRWDGRPDDLEARIDSLLR